MIGGVPLWVFLVIILMFVSGFMALRAMVQDRKQDEKYIEQEGRIYIDRMEKEKESKNLRKQQARDA